tara:strand:+ start:3988 stop:5751 length:1764 start_codon:yes stop_codon:yes gene_type:complete
MRIPTYRGQAQITTQAPGQSFTARKNPNPFVQQALAKGNMQAELFSQAASYAATQRKIKVEARKNEAILGAKEAMLQLSDAFLNDNQPYDIFELDGTGRWDKETKDIKNKLRSKIGTDRYALAAFDTAFAQAELPLRFQLKGQIDTKIEKMHVASVNEGWEDFIFKYSDPNVNTTTFDIDFAAETDKTSKAVELGGFEEGVMSELPNNVLKRIATNLMPAYAGRDLSKAMDLTEAFEQIQLEAAGKIDEAIISDDIPPHVINVLKRISPADAQDILVGTLDNATKFYNFQEKIEDEILETQNRKNTKAYNFALGVHNGDNVSVETMEQLLNPLDLDAFKTKFPNGAVGLEAKHFLNDVLGANGQFWLNREQQDQLAKELDVSTNVIFAAPGEQSEAENSRLFALAETGELTIEELSNSRPLITATQHNNILRQVQAESDEALGEAKQILKLSFRYNELQAIGKDDNLAQASKTAYESAAAELLLESNKRQSEGNPMTRSELREFAQKTLNEFMVVYTETLRVEYDNFIDDWSSTNIFNGFVIDKTDPLGSIQEHYNNLDAAGQTQLNSQLGVFRQRIISAFSNRGLF